MTWPLCNCVVLCFVSHPCGVCQVLGIMCGVISFGLFVSCDRSGSGVTGCVFVSVRVAGHAGKAWSWFLIVTGCHAGVCSLEIYRNHYTVSPCVHSSKWHAAVCQGGLSFYETFYEDLGGISWMFFIIHFLKCLLTQLSILLNLGQLRRLGDQCCVPVVVY